MLANDCTDYSSHTQKRILHIFECIVLYAIAWDDELPASIYPSLVSNYSS